MNLVRNWNRKRGTNR